MESRSMTSGESAYWASGGFPGTWLAAKQFRLGTGIAGAASMALRSRSARRSAPHSRFPSARECLLSWAGLVP